MALGSDVFGPLNEMRTDDLGKTWSGPVEHTDTLGRRDEPQGIVGTMADFWPKWHAKSGKLLGIGSNVRYQNNTVMPTGLRNPVAYWTSLLPCTTETAARCGSS